MRFKLDFKLRPLKSVKWSTSFHRKYYFKTFLNRPQNNPLNREILQLITPMKSNEMVVMIIAIGMLSIFCEIPLMIALQRPHKSTTYCVDSVGYKPVNLV